MYRWLVLVPLMAILVGCGGAASPTPTSPAPTAEANSSAGGPAYPYPYPQPGGPGVTQPPLFTIDQPLDSTMTVISGTGQPGVPIRLVNFMRDAIEMGATVVEPDGTYTITLNDGLRLGDIVGLALGDVSGTSLDPADFTSGPGFRDVSGFGIIFASAVVTN